MNILIIDTIKDVIDTKSLIFVKNHTLVYFYINFYIVLGAFYGIIFQFC